MQFRPLDVLPLCFSNFKKELVKNLKCEVNMEIELNNEQTTPSQQQEQRKASHDLAAARLVKNITCR